MAEPEKLDLKSVNITDEQKAKLKQLFPEVFNEDKIDFDKLKRTIGQELDTGDERFGMTWPGKNDCFKVIQTPSVGTLKPAKEESVNWDTTENLFIEGDNLEVLKLLQGAYYGKIKMIYIDPPYNTGGDFVYPDKYSESLETYLSYTGQVDAEGVIFSTNTDSEGRFHSKWMNMMYSRLYSARNLLSESGFIFVSIDDNEVKNLRTIMDEVFGEENFIDSIIWKKRYGGGAKEKYLVTLHEYVLLYAKNKEAVNPIFVPLPEDSEEKYYKGKDEKYETRGPYRTHPLEAGKAVGDRPNLIFPIPAPDGTQITPKRQWYWNKERTMQALENNELVFAKDKDGNWSVHTKQYLRDTNGSMRQAKSFSVIDDVFTQHGTNEGIEIFGDARIFPYPKPTGLIRKLLDIGLDNSNDIVLDYFAGSCTTAHAVMQLNAEDRGNRKFICVQLPEPCKSESEAYKAGFKTIADIGKKRICWVIKKIKEEQAAKEKDSESKLPGMAEKNTELDLGFKVFKLDKSNFNIWDGTVDKSGDVTEQIEMFIDHIDPNASDEDILHEILLKTRFPLTTKIEELQLAGKKVFSIADKALLICLDRKLTKEVITEMARLQPARIVCLDVGFADNDQLKTNAVQIMKSHGVEDFRTV